MMRHRGGQKRRRADQQRWNEQRAAARLRTLGDVLTAVREKKERRRRAERENR